MKKYVLGVLFAEILVLYVCKNPYIFLDENQWLYISSTVAQVLATIMGLLLAGYQFYEERIFRKIEQDDTLTESIEATKKIFHKKLFILTPIVLATILLCIVSMILWSTDNAHMQLIGNFCFNNSILMLASSLVLMRQFVLDVTDPEAIKRISDMKRMSIEKQNGINEISNQQRNKEKNEGADNKFFYATFLQKFNELENMIITASEILRKEHRISIYRYPLNLAKRIEIIEMYHGELAEILEKINTLRKYRNYLVHGTGQKEVSHQMIESISNINFELHDGLSKYHLLEKERE